MGGWRVVNLIAIPPLSPKMLRPEVRPAVINTWTNLGLIVDANCTYHTMIVCGSFQRLRGVTIRGTLRAGWLGSWLVESVVGERDWSNAGCRSLARPLGEFK